jgi:predicted FMN-binding regulatory protein PaiB
VSFEIAVTRLVGKFKASQHRPEGERSVVAAALAAEGASAVDLNEIIRSPRQC